MTESEASTILKAEIVHHPEYSIFAEALGIAIQALEKQIQKKVVKDGKWSYKCPCCGECAETDCGDAFYDYRLDYCNGCGQKLDWSDEE